MSKNAQGNKISGKQATKDAYIKLFEFLMFDQNYRTLSPNAKILYSFLRNKINYFTNITTATELAIEEAAANGETLKGTKSYRDSDGYIYCIADNTELEYLLNVAESTLTRIKTELHVAGLLLEVPIKNKANRLYPLEPSLDDLQEKWQYIQEINELREKKKIAAAERAQKHAEKKRKAAAEKKAQKLADKQKKISNKQNESYSNKQNESYGNKQNESKKELNLSELELSPSHLEPKYLSIVNRLNNTDLHDTTKIVIQRNIDRLTDNKLDIIVDLFELYKSELSTVAFNAVIARVLKAEIKTSFRGLLEKSIKTEINTKSPESNNNPVRSEIVPKWLKEEEAAEEEKEKSAFSKELKELKDWDSLSDNYKEAISPAILKAINTGRSDQQISAVFGIVIQDIAKLRKNEEDKKRLEEIKKEYRRD
ncbi:MULTISPECIES: replication initiator protein A [Bacillus cereus group]|uniref:replication initiator protein A n=1 Tax=Bacillus cereus group TaxID=86661 RepID=UPI001E5A67E1|nr:replication initiator protein A [Bacillus paranthracis]MCC2413967.1 replication initiator protein A [Bacillus paranthracis]MDK7492490.1 replication initiator protein A [Bacillus paranthracis]